MNINHMACPHCQSPLTSISIETLDGQNTSVEECHNCGGHFLPPVLANFISQNTAKNIDSVVPKALSFPTSPPVCPHCHQIMSAIKDDAVPQTVTVFNCPNNHGEFYPKGQLLLFKKAQDAKINYHKLWGIPIKSAFAVLVPVVIVFAAITIIPNVLNVMQVSQENRVKADEILTQPLITPVSPTEVLISFSTKRAMITSVTFTTGRKDTFTISATPNTTHLVTITDLAPQTVYKYVLNLKDDIGNKVSTSEYTFSTP